ncbi:MAG: CofH family radical SAM protein [Candidatus Omnitrophica bacterium]|nr:CofH family radical SAM protein [Candidatus Omnitrophota bacterium]
MVSPSYGSFGDLHDKILSGELLEREDGLRLYESDDLFSLGALARFVKERLHGKKVFYAANLHINYTNICASNCAFCSFSRFPGDTGTYLLSPEEIGAKLQSVLKKWPLNEIHMVGGHHPEVGLDYYLKVLKMIRQISPALFIKAFAAPEIDFISKKEGISWRETLRRLQEAGLNSLPGGGAEIFSPGVRNKICPDKISGEEWLQIHETAHDLGLPTNATMLYGHIEKPEDRVDHVLRLRELQEKTHGFFAFVPLAYQNQGDKLNQKECGGILDLKVHAVSRLLLTNIPHLKIHWVGTGLKLAQAALSFGVDDFGGIHLEEKIFSEKGRENGGFESLEEFEFLIRQAGCEPCLANSAYGVVE